MPKVVRLKTGEVLYEKAYLSPRPPPKISLCQDWTQELGSKLLGNQKRKLLDSHEEKLLGKLISSNQRNQLQIQFVNDQGDLMKYRMKE